jgi:hypothetical protein
MSKFDTLQDHEFRRDEWAAREQERPRRMLHCIRGEHDECIGCGCLCHSLPAALLALKPLMDALGCEWSNHYHPPSSPDAKWCMVDKKTGHAGRVGMTEAQAVSEVILSAACRIKRLEGVLTKAAEHASAALATVTQEGGR